MGEFMQKFGEFWKVWGPWISVSLVPTVIAGLSISPKTKKAAGAVGKAWDAFKQLMGLLSFATFRDEPGTFQLPLKAHKLLKKNKKSGGPGGGSAAGGCAAGLILFFFGSSILLSSCCAWTGSCKDNDTAGQIATGVIDCAKEAIKSQAAHLLPTIMAILTGGAPNWKEQLDSLKAMGVDASACALATASTQLQAMSTPPPDEGPSAPPEKLKARAKAKADQQKADDYLKSLKLKPTNVQK